MANSPIPTNSTLTAWSDGKTATMLSCTSPPSLSKIFFSSSSVVDMVNEVCNEFVSRGLTPRLRGYICEPFLAHDQLALDLIAPYQLILASWPW